MPVPIAKVIDAQRPLEERIVELLRTQKDTALSLYEIIAPLEEWQSGWIAIYLMAERDQTPPSPTLTRYTNALAKLVASGQVTAAPYQGGMVYFLTGAR